MPAQDVGGGRSLLRGVKRKRGARSADAAEPQELPRILRPPARAKSQKTGVVRRLAPLPTIFARALLGLSQRRLLPCSRRSPSSVVAPQALIEPTHPQPACGRLSGDSKPTDPTHQIPTEFRRRWAKSAGGASGTDIAKADGRQMGVLYGPAHVRLARGCRLSRAHARIFDRRMHEDSGGWRSGLASRGPLASSLGIGCPH